MLSYQAKDKGYENFGRAPSDEVLTALAIMMYTDMLKIGDFVDQGLLQDNYDWLMSRTNDRGGFDLSNGESDELSNPPDEVQITYILWALVRAGLTEGIDYQIGNMNNIADDLITLDRPDPYFLALLCDTMYMLGNETVGKEYG